MPTIFHSCMLPCSTHLPDRPPTAAATHPPPCTEPPVHRRCPLHWPLRGTRPPPAAHVPAHATGSASPLTPAVTGSVTPLILATTSSASPPTLAAAGHISSNSGRRRARLPDSGHWGSLHVVWGPHRPPLFSASSPRGSACHWVCHWFYHYSLILGNDICWVSEKNQIPRWLRIVQFWTCIVCKILCSI
jgi:hypothetical protein